MIETDTILTPDSTDHGSCAVVVCSPWGLLYVVTAVLWSVYAARMARQEWGSEGRWFWSFVTNLILCPVAILWASIFKASKESIQHGTNTRI